MAVQAAGSLRFCAGEWSWGYGAGTVTKAAGRTPVNFCKLFLLSSVIGPLKGQQLHAKTCIVKHQNSFHMTRHGFILSNYPKKEKKSNPPGKCLLDWFLVLPLLVICGGEFKFHFVWSHIGQMLRLIFNLWTKLRTIWRTSRAPLCLHCVVSELLSSVSHLRPGKQFLAEKRGA